MYLRTSARLSVGQALALELRPPDSPLVFVAKGIVVTVNTRRGKPGAAVRFIDLRMQSLR